MSNERVDLEDGSWTTIRVGPVIIGWAGATFTPPEEAKQVSDTSILMGGRMIPFKVMEFERTFPRSGWGEDMDHADLDTVKEEISFIRNFVFYYARSFVIPVPDDSLDLAEDGSLKLTERSWEMLRASLCRFFSAFLSTVQSELNNLEPPDAIHKLFELYAYGYPQKHINEMAWRGTQMRTDLDTSKMNAFVITRGDKRKTLAKDLVAGVSEMSFSGFLGWQARAFYPRDAKLHEPLKNVFLIRANTEREWQLAHRYIRDPKLVWPFFDAMESNVDEASFFVSMEGDPTEKWVAGEVFSGSEFIAKVQGSLFG